MDVTLHRIEEALIRHRLEEAAMLTDMAAKVLNAITTLAQARRTGWRVPWSSSSPTP